MDIIIFERADKGYLRRVNVAQVHGAEFLPVKEFRSYLLTKYLRTSVSADLLRDNVCLTESDGVSDFRLAPSFVDNNLLHDSNE